MAFNCVVVTPEAQVLDKEVGQVVFPAYDGKVGILTDRAPLLAKLGTGELRLTATGGQETSYFIDGGVAQMKDNKLTILTSEAIARDEIDAESARAEYAEAAARVVGPEFTAAQREKQMHRARVLQQMARA